MPWLLMSVSGILQHLTIPASCWHQCVAKGKSSTFDSPSPTGCGLIFLRKKKRRVSCFAAELLKIGKWICSHWQEMPSGLSFICPQNSDNTDSNFNPEEGTPEELTGAD